MTRTFLRWPGEDTGKPPGVPLTDDRFVGHPAAWQPDEG
jgi:hypothetical protein